MKLPSQSGSISRRRFLQEASLASLAVVNGRDLHATLTAGPPGQPSLFSLANDLAIPFYAWPRTLIDYAMPQGKHGTSLHCDETGESIPYQIDAQGLRILFFADLPAGATRSFRWSTASPTLAPHLTATQVGNAIALNTGAVQARIPATQQVDGDAPGPILAMSRGDQWVGTSTVRLEGNAVRSILTEQIEAGPLRSIHRITYTTQTGATYRVTVRAIAGEPHLHLHEDMETFDDGLQGVFRFSWTGIPFAYRQSPNHPYQFPSRPLPTYEQYPWEAIAPAQMDSQFGVVAGIDPNGKLPFSLRIFEPWQDVAAASFANFRCTQDSDAAGIFINRLEDWNDHEYAIWRSSAKLAVGFEYHQPDLTFVWKLARGTRSTAVSFYDHELDRKAMRVTEDAARGVMFGEQRFGTGNFPSSYGLYTQNWQGTLSLDRVKDWSLRVPRNAARPKKLFETCDYTSAEQLYHAITTSELVQNLALSGTRQNHGFGPTGSRVILDDWIPGYQIYREQLTEAQQRRIESIFLLLAYVHAGEDYMPLRFMLAGHPNFLSDVKSVPPGIAFLFPDHPLADTWREEWEAYLGLNTRHHTRPAVAAWETRGGRWTENLGTYVWAFLRPATRAAFLMKQRDGIERLCTPQLASLGDWLVNALSAPFAGESPEVIARLTHEMEIDEGTRRHYWGLVHAADNQPRRVHPPLGAHSERRKPPRTMWYLGHALRNYAPMAAEHLMWAARPADQDMEVPLTGPDAYRVMFKETDNRGTNPHLRSAKYTGFGVTLRAAVDSPNELSVHLMQIDDGHNYRWGFAGEGSCGVVYFFANGKGWSHNGGEDEGDRTDQDTDFGSVFGVWKNGTFRSIGQNVLSEPLYDLQVAQSVRLLPRQGLHAYAWPEYQSREVLLSGNDYFVLHDRVFNPQIAHRFSWFVRKGDAFPTLLPLHLPRHKEWTTLETEQTTGRWVDGSGDSLVLISHRTDLTEEPIEGGARITLPEGEDLLFATATPTQFDQDGVRFRGTSGLLRNRASSYEFALFHGDAIAIPGLAITVVSGHVAIAGRSSDAGCLGFFIAEHGSTVQIVRSGSLATQRLYVDGVPAEVATLPNELRLSLPAGRHTWELTGADPMPLQPEALRGESTRNGAVIRGGITPGATHYEFERSDDGGSTWMLLGTPVQPSFELNALTLDHKYHVRMRACTGTRRGPWCDEIPVYATDTPPAPPDGVRVERTAEGADVSWGHLLGVTAYRLYRRVRPDASFLLVYEGLDTAWHDPSPHNDNAIAAYRVSAVSHLGEGASSRTLTADPVSWRTWNPMGNEPYRRTEGRTSGPLPNDGFGRYYPD